MSQAVLAGLVGRSESWLSQVERGLKQVDSHTVLTRMASVLKVDIGELVGPAGDGARVSPRAYPPLAAIEGAMLRYDSVVAAIDGTVPDVEPGEVRNLRGSAAAVYRSYQATMYEGVGRALPSLICRAETLARSAHGDAPEACEARAVVYDIAAAVLNRVGATSLAWAAADRAMTAAAQSGIPVRVALAAWRMSYVITARRHPRESLDLAMAAAQALERVLPPVPGPLSVYGALHLAALDAAASLRDGTIAVSVRAKAAEIAELTGDRNEFGTAFGPCNVALHRLSAAVEFGNAAEAAQIGESIDPETIPAGCTGRRTQLHLDLARAYVMRRQDTAAVNMLLEAERLSPQLLRYDIRTRDTIELLLRREHRPSTPGLRPLAQRAGVALPARKSGFGTRTRVRVRRVYGCTGWLAVIRRSFINDGNTRKALVRLKRVRIRPSRHEDGGFARTLWYPHPRT